MTGPCAQPAARYAALLTALFAVVPQAAHARHLYVSSYNGGPMVQRFALVNGLPKGAPDKVYAGYGGQIAVSENGTLYTKLSTQAPATVYAFAPGSSQPTRTIVIPNIGRRCRNVEGTLVDSIATDARGDLFAAIDNYESGVVTVQRLRVESTGLRAPCQGVAVYSPQATGQAAPIQSIAFNSTTMPGMAVDARTDLYVVDAGLQGVREFSRAVRNPAPTRALESSYTFEAQSLATDRSGNLYVYLTPWCGNCQGAALNVFPPTAKGGDPPAIAMLFDGQPYNDLNSIAVEAPYLYAANALGSVDVYNAPANGTQLPVYSLQVPNVSAVAVGP